MDDVEGNEKPGVPKDKNNIKFLGWFYKDANGQEHEFKWDEKLTADLNVYAKWDSKCRAAPPSSPAAVRLKCK